MLAQIEREDERDKLAAYEPYPKQRTFHRLGRDYRTRGLFGGNQTGKSICGAAEVAIHLTGLYPKWWEGHRFSRAIRCWAAGESGVATRDNVQTKLVGPPDNDTLWGTGFVPAARLGKTGRASGTANLLDSVAIEHASGRTSTIWFKSYEQGREKWQGPTLDLVWFDEEPPWPLWAEGTTRTSAVPDARVIATFTPLKGLSEVVLFLLGERSIEAAVAQHG